MVFGENVHSYENIVLKLCVRGRRNVKAVYLYLLCHGSPPGETSGDVSHFQADQNITFKHLFILSGILSLRLSSGVFRFRLRYFCFSFLSGSSFSSSSASQIEPQITLSLRYFEIFANSRSEWAKLLASNFPPSSQKLINRFINK